MISHKRKLTLFSVYFTFFVDNLCWAIVFPIFAPYFLDPNNAIFSSEYSQGTRTMVLGFFLMAFSFGQFLGAPVIGEYADRHGRKKALAIGVFFTLIGLMLSAYSMKINNLYLLFAGRLITGLFASSTSVCLSCVSDLCENEKKRVKYFGYMSMAAGLAFVVGAFVAGKLSDPKLSESFSANFPLWIAALLTLVNFLFVLFGFQETFEVHPSIKFHFFAAFKHIGVALQTEKIKRIYTLYFLFLFAWTILFQYISVLMVEKFSFTSSELGNMAFFMGVCWVIGSGYLNKLLIQSFSIHAVLEICLLGFTVLCGLVIFPHKVHSVLAILGICVVFGGIAWPICTGLISSTAPSQMQGKILGISQSIQSFAMTMAALIGGAAFHISLGLPFLISAATSLGAVTLYFLTLKHR